VEEALFFKAAGDELFIKAQGHVTAARCPELKSRVFARLDEGSPVKAVWFDLSTCEYMDSTFLGLIVGVNKRFKAVGGDSVVVLHANPACLGLLRTIGVTRLVRLSDEHKAMPDDMEQVGQRTRASAEFILDAHENLSELSEENKSRFSTLTKALKDSLGGKEG
jgi:anti-anti-sigma factor